MSLSSLPLITTAASEEEGQEEEQSDESSAEESDDDEEEESEEENRQLVRRQSGMKQSELSPERSRKRKAVGSLPPPTPQFENKADALQYELKTMW